MNLNKKAREFLIRMENVRSEEVGHGKIKSIKELQYCEEYLKCALKDIKSELKKLLVEYDAEKKGKEAKK